jgi:hypothetical protein
VEEFLRGPQQSAVFRLFRGLPDARKWAQSNFSRAYHLHGYRGCTGYTATADVGGRGAGACCRVTKTRGWWELQAGRRVEVRRELQGAKGLRRAVQG